MPKHFIFCFPFDNKFFYTYEKMGNMFCFFFLLTSLIEMNDVINPGKTITKTATAAKKSLKK